MFDFEQLENGIEKNIFYEKIISENIKQENVSNFAGLFEHPYIPEYYLVACSECLGEKVIPMSRRKMWKEIAHDLVAMNLNDLICTGAIPMFFLDYLATNSLNVDNAGIFVSTLREELEKYNCTLLCGKTAELGSLIEESHFNVGGFMAGILKKEKLLSKNNVEEDDLIIGFKSSGLHCAGFNLIKSLYLKKLIDENFLKETLKPSFIYSSVVEKLTKSSLIKACAHISKGGIIRNIPRSVPYGLCAFIYEENIPKQEIFEQLKDIAGFDKAYKNFNMGVGFIVIASEENCSEIFEIAKEFEPFIMGSVKKAITKDEINKRIALK